MSEPQDIVVRQASVMVMNALVEASKDLISKGTVSGLAVGTVIGSIASYFGFSVCSAAIAVELVAGAGLASVITAATCPVLVTVGSVAIIGGLIGSVGYLVYEWSKGPNLPNQPLIQNEPKTVQEATDNLIQGIDDVVQQTPDVKEAAIQIMERAVLELRNRPNAIKN